jgi:IS66 Orf2 like protein
VKLGTSLAALVREQLRHDPFSGTIFIFRSKRADRLKNPFAGRNPEAAAGDVRPIHDLGHFAIGPDLFLVIAAAVVCDLEDFVSEVFRLTLARENIELAKFLIAGEPAEYRGSGRHTPRLRYSRAPSSIEGSDFSSLYGSRTRGRMPRPPAALTFATALQRRHWPARWRQTKRCLEQFVPEGVGAVALAFEVRPLTSHYCLKLADLRLQCLDLRLKSGSGRRAHGRGSHWRRPRSRHRHSVASASRVAFAAPNRFQAGGGIGLG